MQRVIVLAVTCACAFGRTAEAHVAPSVDDNNRYIKVTPAADRIRLAYTVFFGEVPGRQMRPSLDTDRDGQLSDEEGMVFGRKLAREVGDSLEVTVDGATLPVVWTTVAVGFGSPAAMVSGAAGSFSVDMVAWHCLKPGARHTVLVKDRFRVPKPGETEVRVEDAPGITVEHARVGAANDSTHDYKFLGPGGPLMDDGLDLAFVVSEKAPPGDGTCTNPSSSTAGSSGTGARALTLVLAFVGGAVLVALGYLVVRRARRR